MLNIIKIFIMVYTMTMGFFISFALVWQLAGHQLTEASIAVILILSFVAEALFLHSVVEVKKDG